jgi:hypothetical protein
LYIFSARDSNKFTVSVNIEAESKVTFNLTYEQLLTRKLGVYENVINVQPGQVNKNDKILSISSIVIVTISPVLCFLRKYRL